MHSRRLACLLLGLWLGGCLFMAWLAAQNPHSLDRMLERPNPLALLPFKSPALSASAKMLLRYQAAEQNRFYFEGWETAQIILGMLFFFFVLFGTREEKVTLALVLGMLLIVAFQRLWMTPQISSLGRVTDFLPDNAPSVDRVKLHALHSGYNILDLLKGILGVTLGARLVFGRRQSRSDRDIRQELDLINKANYRHINR